MKYKFTINKYLDPNTGIEKANPLVEIEQSENYGWFFYDEINNLLCNLTYLEKIVFNIEKVLAEEIDFYEGFGYEVYLISCNKNTATVFNLFENNKVESIIPTLELYEFIRDCRDFVAQFKASS